MSRTVWLPGGGAHEETGARSVWTGAGAHGETTAGGSASEGALAATLDAFTTTATGALAITGSLSVTLDAFGTLPALSGTLAKSLDAFTLSATAAVPIEGALDAALGAFTLSAHSVLPPALNVTLDPFTLSAAGTLAIKGSLAKTLGAFTLDADGALAITGSLAKTLDAFSLASTTSTQMFFFAWTDEATGFSSAMLRQDEEIFAWTITHEEGDFPALQLDLRNPKVGLLAAGRNQWAWLSWKRPADDVIEPLFHGRLVGLPENLQDEVVRLLLVARPSEYIAKKAALAANLKLATHYWDPAFIAEGEDDPDTAWEARPEAVHIDRLSLAVSSSNMIIGEDGTLTITSAGHVYDEMDVALGDTPLRRVNVKLTVTWVQEGEGVTDLTQAMWDAFKAAGNPYYYPLISSFTGDGISSSWPEPESAIGAGWTMDATATIGAAEWSLVWLKEITYLKVALASETIVDQPGKFIYAPGLVWLPAVTHEQDVATGWDTYTTVFPLLPYAINFTVKWTASRPRTEILTFTLEGDVQPLLVDAGDDEEDVLELSATVDEPLDPGGAMPIVDRRRNSYFNTDRGAQSIAFALMLARARILARARAVNVTVTTKLATATGLSLRWNATVLDDRLPDGQASGKVIKYVLSALGDDGDLRAEITIGGTVGRANTITAMAGANTYIDDYIDGYNAESGGTVDAGTGDITYESLDNLDVLDDDGIDLFRMTADRVISSLTIAGGPNDQQTALNIFRKYAIEPSLPDVGDPSYNQPYEPTDVMANNPTDIILELVPIGTQSFETEYALTVSLLMVPRTVDLEAA